MPTYQLTRVVYTISQALSTAATGMSDLHQKGLPTSITVGSIAGIIDGIKAYCFQGASIYRTASHSHQHITSESSPLHSSQVRGYGSSSHVTIDIPETPNQQPVNYRQLIAEFGLNSSSVAFTIANRYFLLTNLLVVFGLPISTTIIWPIVLSDTAFKLIFDLTNELYETNEALATAINDGVETKPTYANWSIFKKLSNNKHCRDLIAIIGTVEHSIVDDLLPWILFIPENALIKLANAYRNFSLASPAARAFTVITPLVGAFLATIIIFQTILFEAEHSYEAYNKILNKKTDMIKSLFDRLSISHFCLQFINYATWLMPVCHGVASSVPVFVWLKKLMKIQAGDLFAKSSMANILTSLGVVIPSIFTFLGTARGHQLSEFREARELLNNRIEDLREVVIQ